MNLFRFVLIRWNEAFGALSAPGKGGFAMCNNNNGNNSCTWVLILVVLLLAFNGNNF